jgi:hypothetical protein
MVTMLVFSVQLAVGLLFPSLLTSDIFALPIENVLLVPDYTMEEIGRLVCSLYSIALISFSLGLLLMSLCTNSAGMQRCSAILNRIVYHYYLRQLVLHGQHPAMAELYADRSQASVDPESVDPYLINWPRGSGSESVCGNTDSDLDPDPDP